MTLEEVTAAALAAAVTAARDQGLACGDPRILSARGNLVVHLAPAPVVARVATLTAFSRTDPFAWLRREVEVAGFAARHGGPVVPPADVSMAGLDPGPHRGAGFAVSLWAYVPARSGPDRGRAGPEATGRALGELHLSLAGYPGELPWMAPAADQISEGLAALERAQVLDERRLAALRSRHGELLAVLNQAGLTHAGPKQAGPSQAGPNQAGLTHAGPSQAGPNQADLTHAGPNHAGPSQAGPNQADGPAVVLHGDAHPGNLLSTGGGDEAGWVWVDLEETSRGPREWDLAVLSGSWDSPGDAHAALAAYAAVTRTAIPPPDRLAPLRPLRDLEAAVWSVCMAYQYPARYREVAAELLARVLADSE